jgi:hypothetical protein
MRYLKIENSKGFYCLKEDIWQEIDKIGKDDLMSLLDKAIETDFEMDEYKPENITNKAHQIIYKNLYLKLSELLENKCRFKDESEQLFKKAFEKYTKELNPEKEK